MQRTYKFPPPTSLIALSLTVQGYDDPQTEADRRAQRCIVASLSSQFPNITIIGEEVGRLHVRCALEKSCFFFSKVARDCPEQQQTGLNARNDLKLKLLNFIA